MIDSTASFRLEMEAAIARLRETGGDHFYGAWSGGSKSEGGHPANVPTGQRDATPPKPLGGSTGARLVHVDGQPYVEKMGNSAGHIREEYAVNKMYEAAGAPVPARALIETDHGPVQRAQYLAGTPWNNYSAAASPADKAEVRKAIQSHFAMDVLVANYDAVGMVGDNIIVSPGKVPIRIDNGGSLRYRAQGKLKDDFGPKIGGLIDRMSNPERGSWTTETYKGISKADLRKQVLDLNAKREAILKATPPELRDLISARLDDLMAVTA